MDRICLIVQKMDIYPIIYPYLKKDMKSDHISSNGIYIQIYISLDRDLAHLCKIGAYFGRGNIWRFGSYQARYYSRLVRPRCQGIPRISFSPSLLFTTLGFPFLKKGWIRHHFFITKGFQRTQNSEAACEKINRGQNVNLQSWENQMLFWKCKITVFWHLFVQLWHLFVHQKNSLKSNFWQSGWDFGSYFPIKSNFHLYPLYNNTNILCKNYWKHSKFIFWKSACRHARKNGLSKLPTFMK